MHEVFLQRLAAHSLLKEDYNFRTFLEYDGDVCTNNNNNRLLQSHGVVIVIMQLRVRSKNTRERFGSLLKGFSKTVDENILLKKHRDVDSWFENEKKFLTDYHMQLVTIDILLLLLILL